MFLWNNKKEPETPQSGKRGRNSGNSSDNSTFQSPESSSEVQLAKRRPTMPMDSETMDFLQKLQDTIDANTRKLDEKMTEINSAVQELR